MDLLCTWLDVIDIVPQYYSEELGQFENTSRTKILNAIQAEEAIIRSNLRPWYGDNLKSKSCRFSSINLPSNQDPDFVMDYSGISGIPTISQVVKFQFTSITEFKAIPDFGAPVDSDIHSPTTVAGVTIPSTLWSSTFREGDVILLSVNVYPSILTLMGAKLGAARVLERTYIKETSMASTDSRDLRSDVNKLLGKITDPTEGEMIEGLSKTMTKSGYLSLDSETVNKYGKWSGDSVKLPSSDSNFYTPD